ncbi:MAG: DNA polymerase III subunit gamma/tau [Betaproteobacteria bacterium]|nr:DNA polymerase III subunit gamma/tau [Betaproteobacteria bacterium]
MSYQVLARKWRPRSFDTLVGQEHVVRALTHALDQQRLHHAYLFTGTRGVGKTTLARIMAKALNCERGVGSRPCGTCSSCMEIDGGRFVDYLELDAASNRGVDDMAQLLEMAAYLPTRGRYKVFVIDEVHQLSGHAFNAMLKTLEEPPEHVKFILATTDPQKIPVTVLSRCLQLNLKQMSLPHIVEHLSRILGEEGIAFELAALRPLARAAGGSMRDALSLLDQAIAHGGGRVEEAAVRDMLGTVGEDHLFAVLDGLAAGDLTAMLAAAEAMRERSLSFDAATQDLAVLVHRIALAQFAPGAVTDPQECASLAPYAGAFEAEFLQLAYQILIHGRRDLPLAPDEFSGFCMSLLRLHTFRPDAGGVVSSSGGTAKSGVAHFARGPQPSAAARASAEGAVPSRREGAPRPAPSDDRPQAADSPARSSVAADIAEVSPPSRQPATAEDWHRMLPALELRGMPRELAQHCELMGIDEQGVRLRLSPAHRSLLLNRMPQDRLQTALQQYLGRAVKLSVEVGEPQGQTPAQRLRDEKQERFEQAVTALEEDRFVRDSIELFDATLSEESIKPL